MRQQVSVATMHFVSLVALWLITTAEAINQNRPFNGPNSVKLKRPLLHLTNFMLKELTCEANVGKNFVFSPLTIHLLMSMELALFPDDSGPIRKALNYDSKVSDQDIAQIHQTYSDMTDEIGKYMHTYKRPRAENDTRRSHMQASERNPGEELPFSFEILTKLVKKNGAKYDEDSFKNNDLSYAFWRLGISFDNVTDKEPASKSRLLEKVAKWANRSGFESPILTGSDLEGDFKYLLLAITHIKTLWLEPFSSHKGGQFWNGGRKDMLESVEILENEFFGIGTRLLYFGGLDDWTGQLEDVLDKRYPRKYMKKDLWAKYSKWNFTALKLALRFDFSLSILTPTDPITNEFKVDHKIDKLILNLSSDQYALSQILDELDSDELQPSYLERVTVPKFSFEYDLEFDEVHGKVEKPNATEPGIAKLRAGLEVSEEGLRGAGSGHHTEKRSAIEYSKGEHINISQPFLFIVRHKKVIMLCGKVTKLSSQSYMLASE